MMVNGESDHSMMALQMHRDKFSSDAEFFAYLHDSSTALESVQKILLEDGYPERVLERCMRMLLQYYDADWCGAVNADLDVGIWTPVWWVYAVEGFQAPTLFHEFEIPSSYANWVDALKNNLPIRVEDTENVKEIDPEEYANYKRLEVRSVLGVPYYKGGTGFLVIRNPKSYFFQMTHAGNDFFILLRLRRTTSDCFWPIRISSQAKGSEIRRMSSSTCWEE